MYPDLFTFTFLDDSVSIKTFGVCLVVAFILFYWMFLRLGKKYSINTAFFRVNLLSFFIATFFISRLAHVFLYYGMLTKSAFSPEYWFSSFFLMSDYYMTCGGAILGFFGMFFLLFRNREDTDRDDALDILVISWLFGAVVAYLGAFFGGQTFGIRSESFISVDYVNTNSILAEFPRFPIALVYVLAIIFIFSLTYIIKKLRREKGFAAGVGAFLWGCMWLVGEWWNDASSDNIAYLWGNLSSWKILNFNQFLAIILICWGSWRIARVIPSPLSDRIIIIGKWVLNRRKKCEEKLEPHLRPLKKWIHKMITRVQDFTKAKK